jgi:hypothetical protein
VHVPDPHRQRKRQAPDPARKLVHGRATRRRAGRAPVPRLGAGL